MSFHKHLCAGLLLIGLAAPNAQAGFWSSLKNSQLLESVKKRAEQAKQLISNNPKIAVATGIGVIATPLTIWAARKLWHRNTPDRTADQEQKDPNTTATSARGEEKLHSNATNNETSEESSTEEESDNAEDNKVLTSSNSNAQANSNSTATQKEILVDEGAKQEAEEQEAEENQIKNHPFYKAGFIKMGFNNNDFCLDFIHELKVQQTTDRRADSPVNVFKPQSLEQDKITQQGKIILICPLVYKGSNDKVFNYLKNNCIKFGKYIAHAYKKQVDLIISSWDSNSENPQKKAKELAQLIRRRDENNNANQIWTIAHGISCQLINKLPEELNQKIDLGIHISSPDFPNTNGTHFEKIYNFYATQDVDQRTATGWAKRKYSADDAKELHNISIKHTGRIPKNSLDLRIALNPQNLIGLLFDIDAHYNKCNDLDACCFNNNNRYPLIAMHPKSKTLAPLIKKYSNARENDYYNSYNHSIHAIHDRKTASGQLFNFGQKGVNIAATSVVSTAIDPDNWQAAKKTACRAGTYTYQFGSSAGGYLGKFFADTLVARYKHITRLATPKPQKSNGSPKYEFKEVLIDKDANEKENNIIENNKTSHTKEQCQLEEILID